MNCDVPLINSSQKTYYERHVNDLIFVLVCSVRRQKGFASCKVALFSEHFNRCRLKCYVHPATFDGAFLLFVIFTVTWFINALYKRITMPELPFVIKSV